jgi:hypothetical protein
MNSPVHCAGLPFVTTRSLTESESQSIRNRVGRARRQNYIRIASVVTLEILSVFGAAWFATSGAEIGFNVTMLAAFLLLPWLAVECLRFGPSQALFRQLEKDLTQGRVDRFEGVVDPIFSHLPSFMRSVKWRLIEPDNPGNQWIERLPKSGILLAANGRVVRGWRVLDSSLSTARPGFRGFSHPVPEYAASHLPENVRARAITPEERAELMLHQSLHRRGQLQGILGAIAFVLMGVAVLKKATGAIQWAAMGAPVVGLVILFVCAKNFRVSWLFGRDLEEGRIVLIFNQEETELTAEYLAVSGALWSEAGKPATWRVESLDAAQRQDSKM